MRQLCLIDKLHQQFPIGLKYSDAVELCVAFYCTTDFLVDVKEIEFSKENIAKVFSQLAEDKFIMEYDFGLSARRGAIEEFTLPLHWIQIIDFSLKQNLFYDQNTVIQLLSK